MQQKTHKFFDLGQSAGPFPSQKPGSEPLHPRAAGPGSGDKMGLNWQNLLSWARGAGVFKLFSPSMSKPEPAPRSAYRAWRSVTTRWADNDAYGHVNNVVYYAWFDTAVNAYLIEQGALDIHGGEVIGLVVETQCNYFSPLAFPQSVDVGLRVAHCGRSSVRYELGVFAADQALPAAQGHFVHVYVDAEHRNPAPLPLSLVQALGPLQSGLP